MAPLTAPALPVFTLTSMLPVPEVALVWPAAMPLKLPVPLIRLALAPLAAPKLALRSSTKPVAPLALLRTTRFCVTTWPTCTVPKFSGVLTSWPAAAW
jgi:hypothetical protein